MNKNELELIKLCIEKLNQNNNYENHTSEVVEMLETLKEVTR